MDTSLMTSYAVKKVELSSAHVFNTNSMHTSTITITITIHIITITII